MLISIFLPETVRERKDLHLDFFGVLTFGVIIASFMLIFKNLSSNALLSSAVFPFLLALSAAAVFFILNEKRLDHPAVDLSFFSRPEFSAAILVGILGGVGMFLFQTMIPSFAQVSLGYSVSTASYSINAMAVTMIIFSAVSGRGCDRLGPEKLMLFSVVVTAVACYLTANFVGGEISYYLTIALAGVGLGSLITPINYIAMRGAGKGSEGVGSGMASLSRTAGGVVGPTVAGFIISQASLSGLSAMENLLNAYSKVFMFGFWVCIAAAFITVALITIRRLRGLS
ncbi:hypothetical protein AKJ40_02830 [candidate division MSBL1 archaeon SCGC-AAA259M10]|uniref:Major facilitator superfamily (MFS) profile domain-containing protein n=1 Tax=candidate division MSBL1 archaeon SCGC-AAA259M10 TaxID=1698270 RepID=A0A133UZD9_9EURY|nr:hypothetical protein AKJ40_02830 [candidate division MSBL1 archaeon SCGC-AAA259M10]